MENLGDYKEILEVIQESGGQDFNRCFQCGLCDTVCPWNRVLDFSMRKVVRQAAFGMTKIENDDIWRCTTCGRCPQQCPRDVGQAESVLSLRRLAQEYGVFPASVKPVRGVRASIIDQGNPLSQPRESRSDWADGLNVPAFEEGMEVLLFVGCYPSYDPRLQKVARATAEILTAAGVEFGILGASETCCGESIRKTGDEELFKRLARQNIKTFIDRGVKKILVSSPHCFHTFKNEYPQFLVNFPVVHMTEFLAELIDQNRLKLRGSTQRKVTYHDPCYLGRHNGVYEQPRAVLERITGLELVEMTESRGQSICCGGGGGRIWMETPMGERLSDLRLEQAMHTGADVLATACPYCITNFEDSRLTLDVEQALEIKDITEIVRECI